MIDWTSATACNLPVISRSTFPEGPAGRSDLWMLGVRLAEGAVGADQVEWATFTSADTRLLWDGSMYQLAYEAEQKARKGSREQRSALALLRSLLTGAQRHELARDGRFTLTAPSGNRYRLYPATRLVEGLARHGSRWYAQAAYCLHADDGTRLPRADATVAQMLTILADEARFLTLANWTAREPNRGWDGEWRRRLNRARQERAA